MEGHEGDLEYLLCEGRLGEFGLFSLEKAHGTSCSSFPVLKWGLQERWVWTQDSVTIRKGSDRARSSTFKCTESRFALNIGKKFFSVWGGEALPQVGLR